MQQKQRNEQQENQTQQKQSNDAQRGAKWSNNSALKRKENKNTSKTAQRSAKRSQTQQKQQQKTWKTLSQQYTRQISLWGLTKADLPEKHQDNLNLLEQSKFSLSEKVKHGLETHIYIEYLESNTGPTLCPKRIHREIHLICSTRKHLLLNYTKIYKMNYRKSLADCENKEE